MSASYKAGPRFLRYVVPSDTDTVTISGLNGDRDGGYLVRARGNCNSIVAAYLVRPNGLTTNQFSTRVDIRTPAVVSGTNINIGAATQVRWHFELWCAAARDASGVPGRRFVARFSRIETPTPEVVEYFSSGVWDDDTTLLTSMVFAAPAGTAQGFQAGSVFEWAPHWSCPW